MATSDIVRQRPDRAGAWLDDAAEASGDIGAEVDYWRGRLAELEERNEEAVAHYASALTARRFHPFAQAAAVRLAEPELAVLAAAGCTIVYALDRLRDRDRDRATAPRRTAFVDRHRRALGGITAAAAAVGALCLLRADPGVWLLCAALGAPGLMHRRLKRFAAAKTLYVSLAWTGVCVGLPWVGLAPRLSAMEIRAGDAIAIAAIPMKIQSFGLL